MSSVRVNHGGKKSQMCNFASKYKHMLHINRCSKGQRVMNKTICFQSFFLSGVITEPRDFYPLICLHLFFQTNMRRSALCHE